MNPENMNTIETTVVEKHPLFQVTKVSKYMAMLLFIIMPFIGAYIGYTYAPAKVVEIEKPVKIEKPVEIKENSYPFTLSEVTVKSPVVTIAGTEPAEDQKFKVTWKYSALGQLDRTWLVFSVVDQDNNVLNSNIFASNVSADYQKGTADVTIENLCSLLSTENCSNDKFFDQNKKYRIRVDGFNCSSKEPSAVDFCPTSETKPIETVYSNEFQITQK